MLRYACLLLNARDSPLDDFWCALQRAELVAGLLLFRTEGTQELEEVHQGGGVLLLDVEAPLLAQVERGVLGEELLLPRVLVLEVRCHFVLLILPDAEVTVEVVGAGRLLVCVFDQVSQPVGHETAHIGHLCKHALVLRCFQLESAVQCLQLFDLVLLFLDGPVESGDLRLDVLGLSGRRVERGDLHRGRVDFDVLVHVQV